MRGKRAVFVATLFLSASLMFCLEPMVARMITPSLGGAPAVWITCMLFFQGALLAGYAYAHATTRWLGVRPQAALHVLVVILPLLVLPIRFDGAAARALVDSPRPALGLLRVLAQGVGLPFFALATSAPLLQRWFGHAREQDPYFLYGASNLGSMIALAAYPALIEPRFGLAEQARGWAWGYGALATLLVACAAVAFRTPSRISLPALPLPVPLPLPPTAGPEGSPEGDPGKGKGKVWRERAAWVALAFVPSSLLLGVTSYVTTDIAAIPLFWVIPLAVYLLSFILVFAERPPLAHARMVRLLPLGVTASVITIVTESATPGALLAALHVGTLFVAAMVCHGELARRRPAVPRLTEFYLFVSIGGVLGGVFNALVAPALFRSVIEYPLALVLACLCRAPASVPAGSAPSASRPRDDALVAIAIGLLAAALIALGRAAKLEPGGLAFKALLGLPLLVSYGLLDRPRRFALAVGATLIASSLYPGASGRTVVSLRSFFGVVKVTHDDAGRFVQLAHGNTIHGRQSLDPALRGVPVLYYHPTGPIADVFEAARRGALAREPRVGAIGLGVGSIACYARPGQEWTFYEINPDVVRLALDPRYFTYLADHFPGPPGESGLRIEVGDARLRLESAPPHGFGLLVLDAFSSDAIPTHLLTREALALYLSKLAVDGIVAAHVSNRYLDLQPLFGALAADAGLVALGRTDLDVSDSERLAGKQESSWVAMARRAEDLGGLGDDPRWRRLEGRGTRMWTDDFSDLLDTYRW